MSKTIYYLGAGASYGKRDESGGILEGIPVVSEIPARFNLFRDSISKAVVPQGEINFWDWFRTNAHDVEQSKQHMLEDIGSLLRLIESRDLLRGKTCVCGFGQRDVEYVAQAS